jgi:hypothetical protein
MKTKILLSLAILITVFVIAVRYQFRNKFESFKESVSQNELNEAQIFKKELGSRILLFSNGDDKIKLLFDKQFDENLAFSVRDTSFSYLYLNGTVTYRKLSNEYIDCLLNKCVIDLHNASSQILINEKETELGIKYGKTFEYWYPKLKDTHIVKKVSNAFDCSIYFNDHSRINFEKNAWVDFEKLLITYDSVMAVTNIQNRRTEIKYASEVAKIRPSLKSDLWNYFDHQLSLNTPQIITTTSISKTFNSVSLGIIDYHVNITSFNNQVFQEVVDDTFLEQWKTNSLRTGAMPYSFCYGASNNCSGYGCSQISVLTDGTGDVIVTIKDRSGEVIRHGYIKGGQSFTFNVSNGSYQVFFYSGSGWNPNKNMPSSTCNFLEGGFVSNENVTKDNYIHLSNQIMSYELILQQDGNFSTKPSSKTEAF